MRIGEFDLFLLAATPTTDKVEIRINKRGDRAGEAGEFEWRPLEEKLEQVIREFYEENF